MHTSAPKSVLTRIPGPPGYVPDPRYEEKKRLFGAVDRYVLQMKVKLMQQIDAGSVGWDDPALLPDEQVFQRLVDCAGKAPLAEGQEADIGNFAMFLWYRHQQARLADLRAAAQLEAKEGLAAGDADPNQAALRK